MTRRVSAGFFFAVFGAAFVWALRAAFAPAPAGAELPAWRRDPQAISAAARAARRADELSEAIAGVLAEAGVGRGDVRYESVTPPSPAEGRFLPRTEMAIDVHRDPESIAASLEAVAKKLSGATLRREARGDVERIGFRLDGAEVVSVELHPLRLPAGRGGPRIAIVIDDVGYVREPVYRLLGLRVRHVDQHTPDGEIITSEGPPEITFAVLPYGPHAEHLADEVHGMGGEVMLHLPMQPVGEPGGFSKQGMLLDGMDPDALRKTIAEGLKKVPHVSGVNNHMGSLLTTRAEPMRVVMAELAARKLFFLDSRTSAQTVAYRLARDGGVAAAERDVFLDDVAETKAIDAQLERLEALAVRHGSAIAIGHPYPETVDALVRWIPTLEAKGIELVRASSLAGLASPSDRSRSKP